MNHNERAIALVGTIVLVLFFAVLMMLSTVDGCLFTCNP